MKSYLCVVPLSLKNCHFEDVYPVKKPYFFVCFLVCGSSSEIKMRLNAAHWVCTMYPSFFNKKLKALYINETDPPRVFPNLLFLLDLP